jgi:AraC-like DNA-binding protein
MATANQLNIFLLLFGGLQGALLTFLLIKKKTYLTSYRFLIAYILVVILQILSKVVSKSWLMGNSHLFYFISYQLPFLYGPLVYLLVLQLRGPHLNLSIAHLLHFVPFLLTATATIVELVYHNPVTRILTDVGTMLWFHLISIVSYHFLAYRSQTKSDIESIAMPALEVRWLKKFILASLVISLTIAFAIFFLYMMYPRLTELRWLFSGLTVFIYWITYNAVSQPELFTVIRGGAAGGPSLQANMKLSVGRVKDRYSSSKLSADAGTAISASLSKLMTVRKLYLDPEISLDTLARNIGCGRHHLSQVINEKEGASFYDYVNRFRIEEAAMHLSDPDHNQKIATIAFASGFNSLSSFNDVFKKTTGMTPSDYRKHAAQARRKQV